MNLWNFGTITQPMIGPTMVPGESKSTLSAPILQEIFDRAVRLKNTLALVRYRELMRSFPAAVDDFPTAAGKGLEGIEKLLEKVIDEACFERTPGVPSPVQRREVLPDQAWASKLYEIGTINRSGMTPGIDESAECLRYVVRQSRETSDVFLKFLERGAVDRWPQLLLSALKTAVRDLDNFTDFTAVNKRRKELRREFVALEQFSTALELPEG